MGKGAPCFHGTKQAGVVIIILEKVGLRAKTITSNKEGNLIIIKVQILNKGVTILNVYACNNSLKIHETKT